MRERIDALLRQIVHIMRLQLILIDKFRLSSIQRKSTSFFGFRFAKATCIIDDVFQFWKMVFLIDTLQTLDR